MNKVIIGLIIIIIIILFFNKESFYNTASMQLQSQAAALQQSQTAALQQSQAAAVQRSQAAAAQRQIQAVQQSQAAAAQRQIKAIQQSQETQKKLFQESLIKGPCSQANYSKELDLEKLESARCTPLDSVQTSFYNFRNTIVSCKKTNNLPIVTTLPSNKKCTANGAPNNCADKGPTTGTVLMCK
jgi:hypothetical protein